ncbi:MAG: hypothetical protein IJ240_08210 [Clostridia bacterium]|nr:hypothetical protein [Clostridia bacterium]
MMDQFLEEVASKRNQTMQSLTIVISWVMLVLCAIWAFIVLQDALYLFSVDIGAAILYLAIALLFGGGALLIFLFKDRLRTDYEYTFTNGTLDFAAVYNNKKRKALGTMNLKNIKACGKVASGSFNRYINTPGLKRSNWFANREADLFYIYFEKNDAKRIIVMEPSEEMVKLIRTAVPQGAYQVN